MCPGKIPVIQPRVEVSEAEVIRNLMEFLFNISAYADELKGLGSNPGLTEFDEGRASTFLVVSQVLEEMCDEAMGTTLDAGGVDEVGPVPYHLTPLATALDAAELNLLLNDAKGG